MKFKAEPNLMVRILGTRPVKYIRFDNNGFYETDNEVLAKRLRAKFKEVKAEVKKTEDVKTEVKKTTTKRKAK